MVIQCCFNGVLQDLCWWCCCFRWGIPPIAPKTAIWPRNDDKHDELILAVFPISSNPHATIIFHRPTRCQTFMVWSLRVIGLNRQNKAHMEVSWNGGTPKSSILVGCSLINHPFWGSPFMEAPQICLLCAATAPALFSLQSSDWQGFWSIAVGCSWAAWNCRGWSALNCGSRSVSVE